ncbi:uncharacterized protein [Lolium perenne]|uniref:uncharacterized protein isoform X2 n=1 Tax=Lolium perenne TaxID=4522 RepID=UPI003A99A0AD
MQQQQPPAQRKMVASKKLMKVGPWGGAGGNPWDDGGHTGIRSITLSYDSRCIDSISVEYDRNGIAVPGERHGGTTGSLTTQVDQAELPGRAPDGRERPVRPGGARRLACDPVAVIEDGARGVRAVRRRRRGGHAVRVRRGGGRGGGVLREERVAAGRRRDVRGGSAAGEGVRQGAEDGYHGLPLGHATARAGAGGAAPAGRAGGAGEGAAPERQCGSDKSQDLLVWSVVGGR